MANNFDPTSKNRAFLSQLLKDLTPAKSALGQTFEKQKQEEEAQKEIDEANALIYPRESLPSEIEQIINPFQENGIISRLPANESMSDDVLNKMHPALRNVQSKISSKEDQKAFDSYLNSPAHRDRLKGFSTPNFSNVDIAPVDEKLSESNNISKKIIDQNINKSPKILNNKIDESLQERKPAGSDEFSYMQMMQDAQKTASQNQLSAALLKAGMQAGAAIAGPGVKMDTSVADALAASADKPVTNVKGLMETETTSRKLKELERSEKEEADLKDPNSQISKFYREKFGPFIPGISKDTSAFAMQKALPQLTQLINVKEAVESRKQLKKESDIKEEQQKIESNKFKAQASVDKQVSQLYKSKDYEAYNAAKDAQVALDAAIASGDKTEAGTAFMQFGKIAQGDNSVLRDGDMVMLAGGYDYTSVSDMLSKLRARAKGGRFNNTELNQMKKIAERVGQLKGQRVQQLFSPIVQRAEANDLNLLEHFDPAQVQEFSNKSNQSGELTTSSSTRVFKSSYKPGVIVDTKSGSYRIGEDGKTGTKINE